MITLVLVEYVCPPEDAQKKEIVAVVGLASSVIDPASVGLAEAVVFQPERPRLPNERVEVTWEDTVLVRVT